MASSTMDSKESVMGIYEFGQSATKTRKCSEKKIKKIKSCWKIRQHQWDEAHTKACLDKCTVKFSKF